MGNLLKDYSEICVVLVLGVVCIVHAVQGGDAGGGGALRAVPLAVARLGLLVAGCPCGARLEGGKGRETAEWREPSRRLARAPEARPRASSWRPRPLARARRSRAASRSRTATACQTAKIYFKKKHPYPHTRWVCIPIICHCPSIQGGRQLICSTLSLLCW